MIDSLGASGSVIQIAVLVGLALMVIVVLLRSIRVVPKGYAGIVERLGRYQRTLNPGLGFLVPVFDRVYTLIDMREQAAAIAPQPLTTKDDFEVRVTTLVHFQVSDARAATYEISDYRGALEKLAIATLRIALESLSIAEAKAVRSKIGEQLSVVLDETTRTWGVRIRSVEGVTITAIDGATTDVVPAERRAI